MILPPERYGIDPALFERTYVAQQDKGWGAHDIDIAQLIERVARIDERVAIMLKPVWRTGLQRGHRVMSRWPTLKCQPQPVPTCKSRPRSRYNA